MSEFLTNRLGATDAKPCSHVFGAVCTREDLQAWGQRLGELEDAITLELTRFKRWAADNEDDPVVADVALRIVRWRNEASQVARDTSLLAPGVVNDVNDVVGVIRTGAAILETMREHTISQPPAGAGTNLFDGVGGFPWVPVLGTVAGLTVLVLLARGR